MARAGSPSGSGRVEMPTRRVSPYERLKQAILVGDLSPDQQLVETALAEWCDVSRTPIREALMRLEHDGLVRRSDRGYVVRERSPEEILDIYETRIVLEATAARVAAVRRSSLDVLALRRVAEGMTSISVDDEDAMVAGNREFHRTLWRASHNDSLIDLLNRLDLHLARYPATTLSQPGRWQEGNEQHRAIVEAIAQQDAESAHRLTTVHFSEARDLRLSIWARGGA